MNIFKKKLNILVLGTDGMLGHDVYEKLTKISCHKKSIINNVIGFDRKKLDHYRISKKCCTLDDFFHHYKHFDYVINCVAMTDTYAAEITNDGKELSYRLNALFPKYLATLCKLKKTKLIHISTDYVFSEKSPSYSDIGFSYFFTSDTPFPVNNYGMHKLMGEQFIKETLSENEYAILRTSWLYGQHNQKSFVHKFIKHAFECMNNNEDIEVTDNEYSVPTSTDTVFKYIYGVLNGKLSGIIHAVCTINDIVSRYDFAKCIAEHYNSLVGMYPNRNKQKIDIDKIKPVTRNDKLQPTYSLMYPTPLSIVDGVVSCNSIIIKWKNELYWFLRNNFNKLI